MGDITIFLRDSYEDHDYNMSCNMGEITIENGDKNVRKCEGFANSMEYSGTDSAGDSEYELNCNMGSILVKFSGEKES